MEMMMGYGVVLVGVVVFGFVGVVLQVQVVLFSEVEGQVLCEEVEWLCVKFEVMEKCLVDGGFLLLLIFVVV